MGKEVSDPITNGGNADKPPQMHLLRPGQVVRGRQVNPIIQMMMALRKLTVAREIAQPDDAGNLNYDGHLAVSDLNAILTLVDPPIGAGGDGGGGTANIVAMSVQSWTTTNDYFSAKVLDFDDGPTGSEINVALPWELRQAKKPDSDLVVQDAYANGDVIIALVSNFGTGITVGDELTYLDLNCGAKRWARKWVYKTFDESGDCVTKHRFVMSSDEMDGSG